MRPFKISEIRQIDYLYLDLNQPVLTGDETPSGPVGSDYSTETWTCIGLSLLEMRPLQDQISEILQINYLDLDLDRPVLTGDDAFRVSEILQINYLDLDLLVLTGNDSPSGSVRFDKSTTWTLTWISSRAT
ncbi:hypothetical protein CDAR_22541 [Caerostris darwini]|uniref:Uncharacterized protein n=1 Tax=Caerostris darwini TaxID=1538125 RepID=A0AAV4V8E2_9ARAC|nr:hypothetical protein CDAR_22541 [Caerostris darwini]